MGNRKSLAKRILTSSYAWSFVAKGFHILCGLFVTVFVNRALGAELKGQYAYVHNLITVLAIVGGLGIYQVYPFRRRQEGEEAKRKFCGVTIALAIIYSVFVLAYVLGTLFTNGGGFDSSLIICLFAGINMVGKIVETQFAMFASIDDFKRCKKFALVMEVSRLLIFLMVFLFFKKNVVAVLFGDCLYFFLGIIMNSTIMNLWKLKPVFKAENLLVILKLGFIPMLFQLLLQLNYNIDVLYMKSFSSVSLANIGLYSVGVQLAAYIWTIPDIFKEVLYSKTAKDDSINDIIWCLRISVIVELLFLLGVFLLGDKILLLLYGEEFVPAITVTKIIFAGVLAMTLFKVLTPLYNAKGRFIGNFIILFISVSMNVVLNIILIPKYDMIGAAIASVAGYGICGVVYLTRFCIDFKIPIWKIIFFGKKDIKELINGHLPAGKKK